MCEACGLRPQAYHGRRLCYGCKPTYRGRPLPCRKCGSRDNYWAEGLCSRCHQYAPQHPESCRECDAWGVYRTHKWLCGGCISWRAVNPTTGSCLGCGRDRHLNRHDGCRACWRQAKLWRPAGEPIDIAEANRHGQQLFFANMHATNYLHHRPALPAAPVKKGPPKPRSRAKAYSQLTLQPVPIVRPAAKFGFPDPPDPDLAAMLDRAVCDHARRHGFRVGSTRDARIAMRVLLGMHRQAAPPFLASEVDRLIPLGLPARSIRAVLFGIGLLEEDRSTTIERWFDHRIESLPAQMVSELRVWFEVLHRGSTVPPRRRPRSETTIKTNLTWALPVLQGWAVEGHRSLREITRVEVLAAVPASGTPRATVGKGLRSIFTVLKERKLIFANPTARIRIGSFERRIPLPAKLDVLKEALDSEDPARAALAALAAFHGLRPVELRNLELDQLRDGRIWLADRVIPLAEPVDQRIRHYLAYRRQKWPDSANPHLFIQYLNAPTTSPVSRNWVNRRLGVAARAIRQDRIIDEAIATGGDVRRICDFFGVTVNTAIHYSEVLDHPGLRAGPSPESGNTRLSSVIDG
jgi:integrase